MNEGTPEPRIPVMIIVEASWEEQNGTLQTAPARMENRSVSGACIRLRSQIKVGTKLKIQWRWDKFIGIAKYCRSEGRDFLVGLQRATEQKGFSQKTVPIAPAITAPREQVKASQLRGERPLPKLKLDTVPILPIASSSAAIPPQRVTHETEIREIPRSSQPQELKTLPSTEPQKQQPPKEKEASKERKRMSRKWFEMGHKDENQDSLQGNSDGNGTGKSEIAARAPVATPRVEHVTAKPAEESSANSQIELLAMEDIYRAAGIMNPRKGYSINKVIEMLHSEHIRGTSKEIKRASVLMALDAAGISVDEVTQDAKVRQEAIDAYETQQRKQFEALLAQKAEENVQIQAELERVKARYGERLRRNLDGIAREKATFGNWLTLKQQESQNITEAVELCLKPQVSEAASNSLAEVSLVNASTKPV